MRAHTRALTQPTTPSEVSGNKKVALNVTRSLTCKLCVSALGVAGAAGVESGGFGACSAA